MRVEKTPKREELFWSKVNKLQGEDACWLWTGAKNCNGYGWITVCENYKQKFYFVHKVSYEWENGSLDEGLIVRHKCDTPLCVRPSHLISGTLKQNSQDMVDRNRHVGSREINETIALEIRQRRAIGMDTRELAREYGLSPQHISNICIGKYWPNVGGPLTRRFEMSDGLILSILADLQFLSQKACAIKHGVSKSSVSHIATGRIKPKFRDTLVN